MNETTRFKISLVTLTDIRDFVDTVTELGGTTVLENGRGTYRVSAKSFLGAVAAVEDWDDIWVVSDNPAIYSAVASFVV